MLGRSFARSGASVKSLPPPASIGRLVVLTVVVGLIVGVISGLTLALPLGNQDRALFAALTAAITAPVTFTVVSSRLRGESESSAGQAHSDLQHPPPFVEPLPSGHVSTASNSSRAGNEPWPGIFSPSLGVRYAASLRCPHHIRAELLRRIERLAGLPRPGTSGAANAFVILVGSEFGMAIPSSRPGYHERSGSAELWNLRLGSPNPHFDPKWDAARRETTLWNRLHRWLPDAFGDPSVAYSTFCWANLSVTAGGHDLGTATSHREGMERSIGPLADAAHSRILAATNNPTYAAVTDWAFSRGASEKNVRLGTEDLRVLSVPRPGYPPTLVAKVGHPSRGVSRASFSVRLRALLHLAEQDVAST